MPSPTILDMNGNKRQQSQPESSLEIEYEYMDMYKEDVGNN
jgi:hypothetical protein